MTTPFWTTELGIVGLTISSLISLVFYVIVSSNKREDTRTTNFQQAMNEIHDMHKQERSEWREDATSRQDKTNEALSELTKAINEVLIKS
jgi:mannitol-specific phosphotransferase system IIBC component